MKLPLEFLKLRYLTDEKFPIGQTHDGYEIAMIPPSVWIAIKKNLNDLEEKLLQTK